MYAELHASSAFSFLEGASLPEDLVRVAAELGLESIALLDSGGLYGAPRFFRAAREQGIRALVGAKLDLEDGSRLPVLVESAEGYRSLCRCLTDAALRGAKGESPILWEDLERLGPGIVALGGDETGPLSQAWKRGGQRALAERVDQLQRVFPGDRFYLEIQRHFRRSEAEWHRVLVDLRASRRLPIVATGGVLAARREDRLVADVFAALRNHVSLDRAGRLLEPNGERRLRSPGEMAMIFADLPECVEESARLAERLEFTLENLGYEFPTFPVPAGETMESYLRGVVWSGARERYCTISPAVRKQIEHELHLIAKLGFCGYFLLVWDLIRFCHREEILVQGRGSAANSAVCYCLGITAVDPVGAGLLFERFLSEGREGWPDIDLDLPSGSRREKVIQEVYRKYGRRGAAMTANVITYRGKSVIREVGKVLDLPEEFIGRFSRLRGSSGFEGQEDFLEKAREAGLPKNHPRAEMFARLFEGVRGLPRHIGQHPGGMVIAQGKLDSVVPLENAAMPGRSVVQWDKDDCEDLGIVKVDLLGLGMMSAIQDSLADAERRGRPLDLAQMPKDDPATYELLCEADTIGVFQVESRAQMATLPRMLPREFYDLVIEVAIIRPGPIKGDLTNPYLERRAGREPVDYIHSDLEPVLKRTLGVPLFQEQILRIAMMMADFTGSEAEELRRALNFSRSPERLQRVQAKLRRALQEKGHTADIVDRVTEAVGSFALYGFPESHAISFAMLAYASAYLKVHRAAEFYAGLLNNQPMGFYSPSTLVQDARRRGLRFLPVSACHSDWRVTVVDDKTLRIGFRMLGEVSHRAVEQLLAERSRRPFLSLSDFLRRVQLTSRERRRLALSGAFNEWAGDRRTALWKAGDDWANVPVVGGLSGLAFRGDEERVQLPRMTLAERLEADYSSCGLTAGDHPMAMVRGALPGVWKASELEQASQDAMVEVAGAVICRQKPGTAKGVVFVSLEDESGVANLIFYPDRYARFRLTLIEEPFLRCRGRVQKERGVIHVLAEDLQRLDLAQQLPEEASHDFH
ncbi:error-prone DNA polymerase [Puniceicoccus vermicola]|uniref:Error-prone DNA polymerase n=2 Tax=Puniceicoccus vermicola TaxID=388746 RepID=A0A7X1AXD9_9BACT|nr:error-prone DNA polymerase [Puniceicoccus vermicola]